MSDMVTRYLNSKAPQVSKARQIPNLETNFFDTQSEFQEGFVTFEKQGDPTKFTPKALQYYTTELKSVVLPDGYVPIEPDAQLNQWTPDKKYYTPGQAGIEGNN